MQLPGSQIDGTKSHYETQRRRSLRAYEQQRGLPAGRSKWIGLLAAAFLLPARVIRRAAGFRGQRTQEAGRAAPAEQQAAPAYRKANIGR